MTKTIEDLLDDESFLLETIRHLEESSAYHHAEALLADVERAKVLRDLDRVRTQLLIARGEPS